jgi:hypothetical protein
MEGEIQRVEGVIKHKHAYVFLGVDLAPLS